MLRSRKHEVISGTTGDKSTWSRFNPNKCRRGHAHADWECCHFCHRVRHRRRPLDDAQENGCTGGSLSGLQARGSEPSTRGLPFATERGRLRTLAEPGNRAAPELMGSSKEEILTTMQTAMRSVGEEPNESRGRVITVGAFVGRSYWLQRLRWLGGRRRRGRYEG